MPGKPKLELATTTLWEYPSQHYGDRIQGDQDFEGATPSWVIWNLLERYTRPNDVVVDPMCGSGTTLDVCRDLARKGVGFDLTPVRPDIKKADARRLPIEDETGDFVFIDPPYSTHIKYSEDPACIGNLDARDPAYYEALGQVLDEVFRTLRNRRYMALYCCDSFRKKKPFCPIGFELFALLRQRFRPVDIVAVVRHNRKLNRRRWHGEALKGNFLLRGFNYLFIMKKETEPESAGAPEGRE